MSFEQVLNGYMKELDCTAKELADVSGLSVSVLSRYRSGKRTPAKGSKQLEGLISGIVKIANLKGRMEYTYVSVSEKFQDTWKEEIDAEDFAVKLDYLIQALDINVSSMAKTMNYDPSFFSRIRSGERMPADVERFMNQFCTYVVRNYEDLQIINVLKGKGEEIEEETEELFPVLQKFLCDSPVFKQEDETAQFVNKLDSFDLNEFIRSVHFDEMKVPTAPFILPANKTYLGVEGQRKGELDFLKGTVLSKSKEPVFMCGDMDMADMAKDEDFSKKWMFGIALLLKKGIEIQVVHNLNRPYRELMLGLEAWIPLYMTGQVKPYYIKGVHNDFYQHMLYTSGNFALTGEGITGFHNKARYTVTNNREELKYYKDRAGCILNKAHSLMEIYNEGNTKEVREFILKAGGETGHWHEMTSSLPLYCLAEAQIEEFLGDKISNEEYAQIFQNVRNLKEHIEGKKGEISVLLEVPDISEKEFSEYPLGISLLEHGINRFIKYDYSSYLEHRKACTKFAEAHGNVVFRPRKQFDFRNINIHILEGKWVWITKVNDPCIQFVIYYPPLRNAIENMNLIIREDES